MLVPVREEVALLLDPNPSRRHHRHHHRRHHHHHHPTGDSSQHSSGGGSGGGSTSGGGGSGGGSSGGGSNTTTSVWTEANATASYSGDVAIGTASVPSGYKLAVEGKIRTREVRVDQDTWPDYVFNDKYQLMSIHELNNYIKDKNHLPGIPSAKNLQKTGLPLGDMQIKMMEKIEELTLYIIELHERIDALEKGEK